MIETLILINIALIFAFVFIQDSLANPDRFRRSDEEEEAAWAAKEEKENK